MGGATATRRWPFAVNSDTGNRTLPRQGAQLLGEADAMFGIQLNEAAGRTVKTEFHRLVRGDTRVDDEIA